MLVLVAFGVFVLPFAFTTPPPIITRFTSTHIFSPGSPAGRAQARVSIRLSQPSNVTITVNDASGAVVKTLAGGEGVTTKTLSIPWDGRGEDGKTLPDGAYTIDLSAQAGEKKFNKSRRVVIDTTAPGAPGLVVRGTGASCIAVVKGPAEATRLTVVAMGTGAHADPRDLPAGGTFTWTWNRRAASGAAVTRPVVIQAATTDLAGNRGIARRACPAANRSRG